MTKWRSRTWSRFSPPVIDMGSMLDMIFILLIFIMLSISFSESREIMDLELPQADSQGAASSESVEILIDQNGNYLMNNVSLTVAMLRKETGTDRFRDKTVIVNSAKTAPMQSFVTLVDILKQGKIKELKLGVRK